MKAYIQHNFTSGVGDFYSDVFAYTNIVSHLKQQGYDIHLIVCTHEREYPDGPNIFQKLFNEKTQSYFTTIKESKKPITDKTFNDTVYYEGPYKSRPGIHHWDIFFDVVPTELDCYTLSTKGYYESKRKDKVLLPEFSQIIENRAQNFLSKIPKDHSFLHFRFCRNDDILKNDILFIKNIEKYIKDSNRVFHLGTHSEYLFYKLKDLQNTYVFDFKDIKQTKEEIDLYFRERKNISTNTQFERLFDTFAEMVSVKYANQIHYYNEYGTLSNFLIYSLLHNKNISIFSIHDELYK